MLRLSTPFTGLFILFISVAGCSGARVLDTKKAEGANLHAYKTFDFYQPLSTADTMTTVSQENVARLEHAIAVAMQKHGYLLSKTNPDLLINIGWVAENASATDAPRYIAHRPYSGSADLVEVSRNPKAR